MKEERRAPPMPNKKIGIDLDGVICDFNYAFRKMFIDVTGKDLFPVEWSDPDKLHPPVWDYDLHFGYTKEERKAVFNKMNESSLFWFNLDCYEENLFTLRSASYEYREVDFYFMTTRTHGKNIKNQTTNWLESYGFQFPSVILTDNKGAIANGIGLDAFIDDKLENILSVQQLSPKTRTYLLNKLYNKDQRNNRMIVVENMKEFLAAEGLNA